MKFTLRLVSAIWLSVMLVIGVFAYLQIREERGRLVGDLQRRAVLVAEAFSDAIEPAAKQSPAAVERIVKKFGQTQRGIAVYDRFANLRTATPDIAPVLPPTLPEVTDAISGNVATQGLRPIGDRTRYIYAAPLLSDNQPVGAVAVLLDASHLDRAEWDRWTSNAVRFLVLALVVSIIAALVVKVSITRPMAEISEWTRALRSGRPVPPPRNVADANLFGPLALEVSRLARSMQRAQVAAEQEAALRLAGESVWTEERLKQFVNLQLKGRPLAGVSNEGLWPLCHIVHVRPTFRPDDWSYYLEVNQKFADTVLDQIKDAEAPLVLIQDYHFAALPALIKAARPDARVAIFWHIPWPNFEAFGICPWQGELLLGMLGADLIGFHTQYYCNNFLETVDRALEARIDWERYSVTRGDHTTYVKPFPISVAPEFVDDPPRVSRPELLRRLGISAEFLGLGVERIDYTKGLPERLSALQFFFESYPQYRERLVFVQLAAPSRSTINRYQEIQREVEEKVRELNQMFQTKTWRPVLYLKAHHEHRDIWAYYRHADFCMVTSLHDGMNLVAKEFVSVRDDEDGALILSRFAGAALVAILD